MGAAKLFIQEFREKSKKLSIKGWIRRQTTANDFDPLTLFYVNLRSCIEGGSNFQEYKFVFYYDSLATWLHLK